MKLTPDQWTTILGCMLGAITASNVDWGKVLSGDHNEQGKLIAAFVMVAYGYFTNKLPKIR